MRRIKYDKRENKILLITALTGTVLTLLVPFWIKFAEPVYQNGPQLVAYVLVALAIICPFATVAVWINYLDSLFYFGRLKRHGYEIPRKKRDYQNQLESIPRIREKDKAEPEFSWESILLSVVAVTAMIAILSMGVSYLRKYAFMGGETYFLFAGICLLAVFWLIGALVYFRQSSTTKYKDDVETDYRKTRQNLMGGLVTMIICFLLTLFCIGMCHTMSEYVYKARVDAGIYSVEDGER